MKHKPTTTTKLKAKENQRNLRSEVDVACPFCGSVEPMAIDEGGGEQQTIVEDCPVCCKPRVVHLESSPDATGFISVRVERDDGL